MPFTGSHAAIVLPLLNKRIFSASGLIMGSMVPDFEFFLTMRAHVEYGHSFFGIFWLNIPVSVLFITLYHNLVRNGLIANLPHFFQVRFLPFIEFNWNKYLKNNVFKVLASIIVGNLTHLLWDSFTHFDGFFVARIPVLDYELLNIPVYDIFQYGFSLLGALAILSFIAKMPNVKCGTRSSFLKIGQYWSLVAIAALIVMFIRFRNVAHFQFGESIVCSITALLIGLLVASILVKHQPSARS